MWNNEDLNNVVFPFSVICKKIHFKFDLDSICHKKTYMMSFSSEKKTHTQSLLLNDRDHKVPNVGFNPPGYLHTSLLLALSPTFTQRKMSTMSTSGKVCTYTIQTIIYYFKFQSKAV